MCFIIVGVTNLEIVMKKMYFLLVLLCISLQSLYSVELDKSKLPKLLGSSNMGKEFYFSFIPCWETSGGDIKLYISSNVKTKVIVDVPGKGYQKIKYTVPNDIIEFTLAPAIGQPYQKIHTQPPEPDKIWRRACVHVVADDPIICYGVTRYQYTSDGFLALPVNSLGKEYIIASYPDVASNDGQWLSSEFTVTAAYDKTEIWFTMGGNDSSTSASGQKPGQKTKWNLNTGDVLMLSSLGHLADLTGSKIEASKPVAVVSGNYCAYVPTNCGCCDFIMEMELPTDTWGTQYHITPIINRLKNSIIRVFAKESNTNIYRDNDLIGTIQTAGGISGVGWLDMRADTGKPRPITIHSDKAISFTQYNTGQLDDGIVSDPFQMVLVPTEQYQKETMFNTPGIRGGFGFPQNYLNLCYEATDSNTIPDDLEIATVEVGQFFWQKLKEMSPNPGTPFIKLQDNKNYFSKTILLPGDGVYKMRADKPFQAYMYGFSYCDSYGFPASVALRSNDYNDFVPPKPEWNMNCSGDVNLDSKVFVIDKATNGSKSSGLAMIYLMSDSSYNYQLSYGEFVAGVDSTTWWKLNVIDRSKDARAFVRFIDKASNDTIILIDFKSPKLRVSKTNMSLRSFGKDSVHFYNYQLYNDSQTDTLSINKISFLKNQDNIPNQELYLVLDDSTTLLNYPFQLKPKDSLSLFIVSNHKRMGTFKDTIIADIHNVCHNFRLTSIEQLTGKRIINVSDYEFQPVIVTDTSRGQITIKNMGDLDLTLNWANTRNYNNFIIIDERLNDLWNNNLVIKPHDSIIFEIIYVPIVTNKRTLTISFGSNSDFDSLLFDSLSILSGYGITRPLVVNGINFGNYHRSNKYIKFPPISKKIVFNNSDSLSISIVGLRKSVSKNFKIDTSDVIGLKIPAFDSAFINVQFDPIQEYYSSCLIDFITDRKWYVSSYLEGNSIYPDYLDIHDYSYYFEPDTALINDFINPKEIYITINNRKDYSGDTLFIVGFQENWVIPSIDFWDDSSAFRYDKSSYKFPLIVAPGESYKINFQALARKAGINKGYLKLLSNSKYDVGINLEIIGINDTSNSVNFDNSFNLFPNPAEDYLLLENLPNNCNKIIIYDGIGKEVKTVEVPNSTKFIKISTKDLPVGAYILRLFVGGEVLDRKFVVIR